MAFTYANHWQLNAAIRHGLVKEIGSELRWRPLSIGICFMYALIDLKDNTYFSRSPQHYPDNSYYEQTALRGALELSTAIRSSQFSLEIVYYLRLLDKGIIAYFDNTLTDLSLATASGLALVYRY